MTKSADAFRTISEVAEDVDLPQHVLRFWETRFPQIKPLKRAGGRRFYRPADVELLVTIRRLLYDEGYTIKGVQRLLRERGGRADKATSGQAAGEGPDGADGDAIDDETEALVEATVDGAIDASPERDEAGDTVAAALEPDGAPEAAELAGPAKRASRIDASDLDRLRAALDAITACEDILRAARRPSSG